MAPELEILGNPVASEEIVVLVVTRNKNLASDSDVPADAKVEITKAPFHKVMKLGQGARMTRGDAEWHFAKSQSWAPGNPLGLKVLTLEEAQKLNEAAKSDSGNSGGSSSDPDYSGMKVAELRGVLVEKGLASAEEADALSKPEILKLLA